MTTRKQHSQPCKECPFRRSSPRRYLGGNSLCNFTKVALQEHPHECHMRTEFQCAGRAILWANCGKLPRRNDLLKLPANREDVFSQVKEFVEHHDY